MKKIVAIDGGGIKGAFPASLLASLEAAIGTPIVEHFDLIAGTSTGGIIALCLGLGFTAKDTLGFYQDHGPKIFGGNRLRRSLRHIGFTKYAAEPLREALRAQFGDRRLGESSVRLVIPSTQLQTGKVHIYKTAHHRRLETDYRERVVDVALATASAPSYFPTHRSAAGTPLVDGGVWCNNPAGLAAVEAISMLGWTKGEVELLSIGCTGTAPTTKASFPWSGKLYWATQIVDVVMHAQSSASHGTAQHVLGHDRVLRIDPPIAVGRFKLDDARKLPDLIGLGASEAREALPKIRERFLGERVEAFEPFHKL